VGSTGRNQLCPCGSGRKYKKCCLMREEAASRSAEPEIDPGHAIDQRMVTALFRFARRRFGDDWLRAAEDAYPAVVDDLGMQMFGPWAAYHHEHDGQRLVSLFLEQQGWSCSPTERAWLEAQLATRISVWEVRKAEPGVGLHMTDLLVGEERFVQERAASELLVVHDAILARVIDFEERSLLGGSHPQPLPPGTAAEVLKTFRSQLHLPRKKPVTSERLESVRANVRLIQLWDDACRAIENRAPPELRNSDGDELLMTADRFTLRCGSRAEVENQLEGIPTAERDDDDDDGATTFAFVAESDTSFGTVVGRAVLSTDRLKLTTNSLRRADALRELVEKTCGSLISHHSRDHTDPMALPPAPRGDAAAHEPPPDAAAIISRFKAEHYATWPDDPLPALDGLTPREAAKKASYRPRLELLLKTMENSESRRPEEERYDFRTLWQELLGD